MAAGSAEAIASPSKETTEAASISGTWPTSSVRIRSSRLDLLVPLPPYASLIAPPRRRMPSGGSRGPAVSRHPSAARRPRLSGVAVRPSAAPAPPRRGAARRRSATLGRPAALWPSAASSSTPVISADLQHGLVDQQVQPVDHRAPGGPPRPPRAGSATGRRAPRTGCPTEAGTAGTSGSAAPAVVVLTTSGAEQALGRGRPRLGRPAAARPRPPRLPGRRPGPASRTYAVTSPVTAARAASAERAVAPPPSTAAAATVPGRAPRAASAATMPGTSVFSPSRRPSRSSTVLAAPTASTSGDAPSSSGSTAALSGIVSDRPAQDGSRPARKPASRSSVDVEARRRPSPCSPSAA